jgi:hypothetical protein
MSRLVLFDIAGASEICIIRFANFPNWSNVDAFMISKAKRTARPVIKHSQRGFLRPEQINFSSSFAWNKREGTVALKSSLREMLSRGALISVK